MKVPLILRNLLNKLPYVRRLYQNSLDYSDFKRNSCFPAVHYYSPIISVDEIKKREFEIWNKDEKESINGIDLRKEDQLELLKNLIKYYNELPFKSEKQTDLRYYFDNDQYCHSDSILLYSMIRHFKPKRIVEIGSGFSSAVMLDTNELFFNNKIKLTLIDPNPERLFSIMKEKDKIDVTVIAKEVQAVPLDTFIKLQAGDILFIDSSHVVKTGSDVHHILLNILPILQAGVLVHFHDVFYPFEYPKEWVLAGRNWNEIYFLQAFLTYNNKFDIRLFSDFIHKYYKEAFNEMPLSYKNNGGNLWIEKK